MLALFAGAGAALVGALPLFFQLIFDLVHRGRQFVGDLLVPVPGRRRHLLPGRHQDPVHRRLGPGPRARAGQGEHRLPGEPARRSRTKGGYVPGGILLWGPPGTGKTLMAEAVAGETGKPYVFVDPGAFINMFMGVGILKVKSLFRKLRKLALRYGGVIVFFDEADALGNRGALAQGGAGRRPARDDAGAVPGRRVPRLLATCSRRLAAAMLASTGRWAGSAAETVVAIVMGGMGGGGGMGTLQALLTELSGLKKPRGFINRYVRRVARHAAEAAAEVPDPRDDGDQHAGGAGRGAAAAGPHRPHLQGRLPEQGRPGAHLRGLPRQGAARARPPSRSTSSPPSRRTPPAPRSRTSSTRR